MRYCCLLAVLIGVSGCSSGLETGYQPRKLGASDEIRRGYYAQPFTPEAKAARDYEHDFGPEPSGPKGMQTGPHR